MYSVERPTPLQRSSDIAINSELSRKKKSTAVVILQAAASVYQEPHYVQTPDLVLTLYIELLRTCTFY